MKTELYYGNKKECIYAGCAGNMFAVEHDKVVEEGLYFVKLKDHEYVELDELLVNKNKKTIIKDYATKKGEIFVDDLVLINKLVDSKIRTKKK